MSLFSVLKFIANHPVNRGQKLASIGRFAKWQISSRLAPGAILYDWINDSKFLVRNGETGLTGNIYTGLHEFPDMAYVLHVLRPEDTFVDVGANVGSYTILAGSGIGATGYAFEPVPGTYRRLVDNIRLNRMEGRVQAFNVGLAQSEGVIRFTSDLDTVNHALADNEAAANVIEVKVTTLDQALHGANPGMMKIDVEGYETPVLQGASMTLSNPQLHSIIMELNGSGSRYGFDESKIVQRLLEHDFRSYSYDPLSRRLTSLNGKNQEEGNTIFIRNEAFVRERIETAPKFNVLGVSV